MLVLCCGSPWWLRSGQAPFTPNRQDRRPRRTPLIRPLPIRPRQPNIARLRRRHTLLLRRLHMPHQLRTHPTILQGTRPAIRVRHRPETTRRVATRGRATPRVAPARHPRPELPLEVAGPNSRRTRIVEQPSLRTAPVARPVTTQACPALVERRHSRRTPVVEQLLLRTTPPARPARPMEVYPAPAA
jgi:hypothetical protein